MLLQKQYSDCCKKKKSVTLFSLLNGQDFARQAYPKAVTFFFFKLKLNNKDLTIFQTSFRPCFPQLGFCPQPAGVGAAGRREGSSAHTWAVQVRRQLTGDMEMSAS